MANKTLLVAKREYIENVRTKTFWVGILMFPIIWIVALFVPGLLAKAKAVKKYAVVDQTASAWFSTEFEQRTEVPDLARVYRDWKARSLGDAPPLPDAVVKIFAQTKEAESKRSEEVPTANLDQMFRAYHKLSAITDAQIEQVGPYLPMLKSLFKKLPDALVQRILKGTDAERADIDKALDSGMLNVESLKKMRDAGRAFVTDSTAWWQRLAKSEDEALQKRAASYLSTSTIDKFERVAPGSEEELRKQLDAGKLFAYFVVPEDPVGKRPAKAKPKPDDGAKAPGDGQGDDDKDDDKDDKTDGPSDPTLFKYVTKKENLADRDLREWFSRTAKDVVRERRLETLDIESADADWLSANIRFDEKQALADGTEAKVEKSDVIGQFAPIAFVYLLWISVFTIANLLLTNTIEEKSNRLIEVLLSSVSPLQLMMGKIFGLAGTGLTMVGSWAIFAILGIKLVPLFGEDFAANIAEWGLAQIVTNPRYLLSFIIYFFFGYLLYAALLVGIGSVCNSLKEAQNLMQPVILLLIVPLLAMFPIAQEPNGTMAKVMSYIPPFTPFVMMNRAGGPPTLLEYGITTVILLVAVGLAIMFAAKIFRIGILMTGKPPKVREIFGWLKAPVGSVYVREEKDESAS